jgi:hypothetical protein
MKQALATAIPADVGEVVRRTFDRMGLAETLIARAKRRYPDDALNIDRVFGAACPNESMMSKSDIVYQAHVLELIERARRGASPVPATDAEIVCVLSDSSLASPLTRTASTVYERLFAKLFPVQARKLGKERTREAWPDAAQQSLESMRNALRDTTRSWSAKR